MWKLRKKVCSKKVEAPVAKKNGDGDIISEPSKLKKLYEETYKMRLKHRQMKPEITNLFLLKMELFNLRMVVTRNITSKSWCEKDLLKVFKKLKKNKSPDSHRLIFELFRPEIIGKDLLLSLLMLCNKVKTQLTIPEFLTLENYFHMWKSKKVATKLPPFAVLSTLLLVDQNC